MHFPKYWARGTWAGRDRTGREVSRDAWGWSEASIADARQHGAQVARKQIESFDPGNPPTNRYGYPNRPLREPVLRELASGGEDGLTAVITRNSYGCEVLNTNRLVFVDVDLPDTSASAGFFPSLFGGRQARENARATAEADRIVLLENWQRQHPPASFRVYRTAAGLRYLLTSALHAPDEPLIDGLFAAVEADPAYRHLCRQQKSYRARLTPKYWRCDAKPPPHRYPFEDPAQTAAMAQWAERYAHATRGHSVCQLLVTVGPGLTAPEIQPVLALHDQATRAESSGPLA